MQCKIRNLTLFFLILQILTRFFIKLPNTAHMKENNGASSTHPPSLLPVRILFVDDDPAFLLMLEHGFSKNGIIAIPAQSGSEALMEITTARDPMDLVLTDYRMPEMDGLKLIKRLYAARPLFPIIFCSSYFPEDCLREVRKISKQIYPIRCLEKPIPVMQLCTYIREDIDRWKEWRRVFRKSL